MTIKNLSKRKCPYCGKEFEPKVFWQKFCCPEHQKAYWNDMRKGNRALRQKIIELDKEIEELKQKISN